MMMHLHKKIFLLNLKSLNESAQDNFTVLSTEAISTSKKKKAYSC